jgi:hypothetical protein
LHVPGIAGDALQLAIMALPTGKRGRGSMLAKVLTVAVVEMDGALFEAASPGGTQR